jgi:Ca-activated chloride channel family protein
MNRAIAAFLFFTIVLCSPVIGQDKETKPQAAPEKAPVSYGFVVDNSGSLRQFLDRMTTLVSDIVEDNGAEDEAFLVSFVSTEKIVLRQEFTNRKSEIDDAAQNMFIEGGHTAILDALKSSADYLSLNARADAGRSRALVLITDGEDRASGSKIEDVIKLLKEQNIRVYVIAIAPEKVYLKIPERLAKETGGSVLTPKTTKDLTKAAKDIAAAIRTK